MFTSSNTRGQFFARKTNLFWLTLAVILGLAGFNPNSLLARDSVSTANMSTSYATVSPSIISTDQQATITIQLRNTGSTDATASVVAGENGTEELAYVPNSASHGGTAKENKIVWDNITVKATRSVKLSFKMTPKKPVTSEKGVTIGAAISMFGQVGDVKIVSANLTLSPENRPAPSDLKAEKSASKSAIAYGQKLTYTIKLSNSGANNITANVSDPLTDQRLAYVAGSVSAGGSYDEATKTVSWNNVTVPAGGSVELSFEVKVVVYVNAPSPSTNTVTITVNGQSFTRSASVLVVQSDIGPAPDPKSNLEMSSMTASPPYIGPGQEVNYTIKLNNTGGSKAVASVTNPLPTELALVAGSISDGGVYDEATRTISWANVEVEATSQKNLSYKATPASEVTKPTPVKSTATIVSDGVSLERSFLVLLLPQAPGNDKVRPIVESVTVNGGESMTNNRQVTLNIRAVDNDSLDKMHIQEWQINADRPSWELVNSQENMTYQETVAWTLGEQPGTHFIAVWVVDASGNVSLLNRNAVAFVSLTGSGEVGARGFAPFMVQLKAGVTVSATLETTSGDADLYVWFPGNLGLPDEASTNEGVATDTVSFTTSKAGIYLFLVYGIEKSSYTFSMTQSAESTANASQLTAKPINFTAEPLMSWLGFDPLGVLEVPNNAATTIYVPVITR
ncbi:MAG: DUF11 domain-containing protein [Chloroflexales bacterium]|nr:DUF11 domain-containing protein [Chloroflexales bacterium]